MENSPIEYTEKSDIWSIGCIAYELASLQPPFVPSSNTDHLTLAAKIKEGTFGPIPKTYSEELVRSINWMLKTDPKQRANVEDLLNLPYVSFSEMFDFITVEHKAARELLEEEFESFEDQRGRGQKERR